MFPVFGETPNLLLHSFARLPWPAPDDWHRGDHSLRPKGHRSLKGSPVLIKNRGPAWSCSIFWPDLMGSIEHYDLFNYEFFVGGFIFFQNSPTKPGSWLPASWKWAKQQIPLFLEI
jgi:hypothetical protein